LVGHGGMPMVPDGPSTGCRRNKSRHHDGKNDVIPIGALAS
jgi:hypothetical protein